MALHIQRKRMSAIKVFCGFMIVLLSVLNIFMILAAIASDFDYWAQASDDSKWRGLVMYFAWIAAYCWLETQEPDQ